MRHLQPVILGTDSNAYGMARSFHEEYGVTSYIVGRLPLFETNRSRILQARIEPDLLGGRFADILIDQARQIRRRQPDAALVLIACSDGYAEKIIENRNRLSSEYILPFIGRDLHVRVKDKESFYALCDEHGLAYPKTRRIVRSNYGTEAIRLASELGYPLMLKPSDGIRFLAAKFPGKRKAYVIRTESELRTELDRIYRSDYSGAMLMQEYLSGEDTDLRVLTALSDPGGKVRLMSLGRPLLEDPTPEFAGISCALIDDYDEALFAEYRRFLEAIGYVGFSCFDLKFDVRQRRFKVLELNIRQGRNSYFVTGRGCNLARFLTQSFSPDAPESRSDADCVYAQTEHLWLGLDQRTLFRHLRDPEIAERARRLIREGKFSQTLYYRKDFDIGRRLRAVRYYGSFASKFARHKK